MNLLLNFQKWIMKNKKKWNCKIYIFIIFREMDAEDKLKILK